MVGRKPRADAQRNRALLLEAAKKAFSEKGSAASLDEIARAAGVGTGTLYRHFPTRDALVEAVYRNETEQLAAAATRVSESLPPVDALREWLMLLVDFMTTKRGMSEALASIVWEAPDLYENSGTQIQQVAARLVDRAVAAGEIRMEIGPMDLLRALAGIAYIIPEPDWRRSAESLVDILIAGLSARARP